MPRPWWVIKVLPRCAGPRLPALLHLDNPPDGPWLIIRYRAMTLGFIGKPI